MSSPCFALVDANNFYASCEKLFRPDLKNKPVIVLSNNDGCVVARSKEVKALGIKTGTPIFKLQNEISKFGIVLFSSNYALYADVSSRIMSVLEELAPRLEIYSIDEAFLDFSGMSANFHLETYGKHVQKTVYQYTGISVGVGIAPTKTLAKLANHAAKTYPATGGVVDLSQKIRQVKLMQITPVSEIWGVGRQISKQLELLGIKTALQLAEADPKLIRKQFSVVLERTVHELNGTSCLSLDEVSTPKKQIVSSRSFGERISEYQPMREAVASYVARAAEKLRQEKQHARSLTVFLRTNPFSEKEPYYANSATGSLRLPTDDTRDLLVLAQNLLKLIWKDGYRFMKAGIILNDFYKPDLYQPDLFEPITLREKSKEMMSILDKINNSNKGKIWFASQGIAKNWQMKRQHLSPAYTTSWDELPRAK